MPPGAIGTTGWYKYHQPVLVPLGGCHAASSLVQSVRVSASVSLGRVYWAMSNGLPCIGPTSNGLHLMGRHSMGQHLMGRHLMGHHQLAQHLMPAI